MNDTQGRHNAILENRQRLQLSGVTDVDSFDEDEIRLFTQLGELTIKGKDLHINEISVESGDVSVEGDIWALVYGEKDRKKKLSGNLLVSNSIGLPSARRRRSTTNICSSFFSPSCPRSSSVGCSSVILIVFAPGWYPII